jgi:hypothetical protein
MKSIGCLQWPCCLHQSGAPHEGYRPVSKINTQLKEGGCHKMMYNKTVLKLYLQMLHAAAGTEPHLIGANSMTIVNS